MAMTGKKVRNLRGHVFHDGIQQVKSLMIVTFGSYQLLEDAQEPILKHQIHICVTHSLLAMELHQIWKTGQDG